jgi:hypothetical protein
MKITSIGSFKLEDQAFTVHDPAVTETALILTGFQNQTCAWHSWHGFLGVSGRVPGISFDFSSPRTGGGAVVGYIIIEP